MCFLYFYLLHRGNQNFFIKLEYLFNFGYFAVLEYILIANENILQLILISNSEFFQLRDYNYKLFREREQEYEFGHNYGY